VLSGKRLLVTGGSRGIGAAIVQLAVEEGADVVFTYRSNDDAAQAVVDGVLAAHPARRCVALRCDVTDPAKMREVVGEAVEVLGGIDALVNNAGLARDAAFARLRREDWDEVIDTNLGSMYNATQPLLMGFVRQRSGAIINMTSIVAIYGTAGQASYAASKGGIIGLTKALAKEVAPFGVRVNAVAPGLIETDMLAAVPDERLALLTARVPAGRLGTVDDVSQLVCFLASDRSRYITGQVIEVAGGLVL
jgi:3-oxoacyl-[acyl-carrier protein] reductase